MPHPELPYLGAGTITLIGATRRDGKFPADGLKAVAATVGLTIVASATATTKLAPLVHAIGLLLFMAAIYGAIHTNQKKAVKK
jgi:hypothetical protein